jgi:hypothetical protein
MVGFLVAFAVIEKQSFLFSVDTPKTHLAKLWQGMLRYNQYENNEYLGHRRTAKIY